MAEEQMEITLDRHDLNCEERGEYRCSQETETEIEYEEVPDDE